MKRFYRIYRLVVLMLAVSIPAGGYAPTSAQAADRLEPYSADFTVLTDAAGRWADIRVSLDFKIHNNDPGSLIGSKFICMHDIDSIEVSDGTGRRLPFTLKKYPRKRIIWEYGPAHDGTRRARIRFTMRNAVKRDDDGYVIHIDWIGGWTRDVLDVRYRLQLPEVVSAGDILSVFPKTFSVSATDTGTVISHRAAKLTTKAFKVRVRKTGLPEPASAQKSAPPKKAAPSKSDTHVLKHVRFAPRTKKIDRLVFDLNRAAPYEVVYAQGDDQAQIVWKVPLTISAAAKQTQKPRSRYLDRISWKKTTAGLMTCTIRLKRPDVALKYGSLPNPPRVYVDLIAQPAPQTKSRAPEKTVTPPMPAVREKPIEAPLLPPAAKIAKKPAAAQRPEITETAIIPTTSTTTTIAPAEKTRAPIEEKLAYMKAQKLYHLKDYLNAINSYEKFLKKFPGTVLKEDALYEIAECYFMVSKAGKGDYWQRAREAYQQAVSSFPLSHRVPQAQFNIAECYRQVKFYLEARTQYILVAERYAGQPLAVEAHYWTAECFYQMQKYEEALAAFQKLVEEFPDNPYIKEASFRIADCYVQLKDFDRAEFYYEKAISRWPDMASLSVKTLNGMALSYYYKGKFKKSREAFFLSYNLYPEQENRVRTLRFIGDSYQWEGEMQKALSVYAAIVDEYPGTTEQLIAVLRIADLGVNVSGLDTGKFTFKMFNPYTEHEKAYRWVIENDPTGELLTEAYYKLGFTLAQKGEYARAVENFKKSMFQQGTGLYYKKSFENIQTILMRMISAAARDEDYFNAVELYKKHEKVFFADVDDCDFRRDVGISYLELGFVKRAENMFEQILQNTDSPDCRNRAMVGMGRIEIARGDLPAAQERLNLLLYGSEPLKSRIAEQAYHYLGDAYFEDGQFQKSVDAYTSGMKDKKVTFRYAKSLYRLGQAFGRIGYYYNGIQALRRFADVVRGVDSHREEIEGYTDEALLMMGDYLVQKGKHAAAISAYERLADSTKNEDKKGWALVRWGSVLRLIGEDKQAEQVYSRLMHEMPYTVMGKFAQAWYADLQWEASNQNDLKQFM